jgi:hypothetical protein
MDARWRQTRGSIVPPQPTVAANDREQVDRNAKTYASMKGALCIAALCIEVSHVRRTGALAPAQQGEHTIVIC